MDIIWQGLKEGIWLILNFDAEIMQITLLSLRVSLTALLISALVGIPAGAVLALKDMPVRPFFKYNLYL